MTGLGKLEPIFGDRDATQGPLWLGNPRLQGGGGNRGGRSGGGCSAAIHRLFYHRLDLVVEGFPVYGFAFIEAFYP